MRVGGAVLHLIASLLCQDGRALQFCSKVKGDRELVELACRQNGLALQYTSPAMQKDPACVVAATAQNDKSMAFAQEVKGKDRRDAVLVAISNYHVERLSLHGAAYHTEMVPVVLSTATTLIMFSDRLWMLLKSTAISSRLRRSMSAQWMLVVTMIDL